jgi:hypothetical protein
MVKKLADQSSHYRASAADWSEFLTCWAKQMDQAFEPTVGYAPPEDLVVIEGRRLPKSYLDFVQATGGKGWAMPGDKKRYGDNSLAIGTIGDVGLLKKRDRLTWKAWTDNPLNRTIPDRDYYNYSSSQQAGLFRDQYLGALVYAGNLGHGAVLALNPLEQTREGEWEAWYLSTKLPGALRYRSFAELMQRMYFADISPERDLRNLAATDVNNTCAGRIFTRYRIPD